MKIRCIITAAAALTLIGCGDVSDVRVTIKPSEIYSFSEISRAVEEVKSTFHSEFDGCTMTSLYYSDEYRARMREDNSFLDDVTNENDVICILAHFYTDDGERGDGLYPDSEYVWDFTLLRDGKGWEVKAWGEC